MSAFGESASSAPQSPDQVINPNGGGPGLSSQAASRSDSGYGGSSAYLLAAILLAGAGAWILWKKKGGITGLGSAQSRKLLIEETRSLGNRQHLVVASYEGRKFLLGITTGRIELLTHLSDEDLGPGPEDTRA